jgi:hypothetical protein
MILRDRTEQADSFLPLAPVRGRPAQGDHCAIAHVFCDDEISLRSVIPTEAEGSWLALSSDTVAGIISQPSCLCSSIRLSSARPDPYLRPEKGVPSGRFCGSCSLRKVYSSEYGILAPDSSPSSHYQKRCRMALTPSDIAAIRKDIEAQSRAIARLGILRAAALLVLTVTFVQAFHRLDASRPEIESLNSIMDEQKDVMQREALRVKTLFSLPTFAPYQSPFAPGSDCGLSDRLRLNQAYGQGSLVTSAARTWVGACQKLGDVYRQAFLLKLPLVGSDVEIDLRWWAFWAPVLFVLAELYLAILRKKRSLLSRNALPLKNADELGELSISGRLFLPSKSGEEAPFTKHPYQYFRLLDVILSGGLGVFLLVESRRVWQGLNPETIRILLLFYGTAVFYAAAYYCYVASRLSVAVQRASGSTRRESWGHRAWQRRKEFVFRVKERLGARIPINVGSALLLLTLLLPISIISCNDVRKHPEKYNNKEVPAFFVYQGESGVGLGYIDFGKGYKLFLGESYWPPAFYMGGTQPAQMFYTGFFEPRQFPLPVSPTAVFSERLGILGYRAILGLVALGALMQIKRLKPKGARIQNNFYVLTYILSCTVLLFSLTDMAFAWIASWFSLPVYWLMTVPWLAGLLAVLAPRLVANQRVRRTLVPIATVAGILYIPVPLFAAAFLLQWQSTQFAVSFSLYLAGAALLTFGYSVLFEKLQTNT